MVKVINRIYNEIFTDGTTNWLLGNVGEWQKLKLLLEVGIELNGSNQNQIGIDYIENSFKLLNGKKWSDYGFDIGQVVTLKYLLEKDTDGNGSIDQITNVEIQFTITNLYDDVMEVDETIDIENMETIPTNYGTKKISKVLFFVDEETEGVRIQYQHISNDDYQATNLFSVIDQTTTELFSNTIKQTPIGVWSPLIPVGKQSGMSIRTGRIRKINSLSEDNIFATLRNVTHESLIIGTQRTSFFQNGYGYDERMKPMLMTSTVSLPATYKNVTDNNYHNQNAFSGNYTNGNSNQCFLFNAATTYNQSIAISTQFRITSTNDVSSSDYLRLVLIRYAGGGSLNIANVTELKRWNNAQAQQGQTLTHNEIKNLTINPGDSYGLFLEYHHNKDSNYPTQRQVVVKIEETKLIFSKKNETFESDNYKKYYEMELEYMISSIFENITDLQSLTPPSYLGGDGSLTDNFDIKFFPKWNNPNVLIKNDMSHTERLGNTGWFNENFNELENNFLIESLQYFDDNGNPVDAIDYFAPTKVKGVVSGINNLNTDTECGFGFAWIPKYEEDYKNKETPFYQNTFVNTGTTTDGFKVDTFYPLTNVGGGINGASIDTKNVKFTNIGGGKVSFEMIFTPNPNFYLFFDDRNDDDRKYVLWLSVADQTLIRNFSDRVSLLVDLNSMIKTVPPAGPYPYIQNAFLEHPFDENAIGVDEYDGFVQDDVLCRLPFQLDPITTEFKKMRFAIEIYNPSTGVKKILEKFDVDMTQYFDDANGVPQFNLNQTRGFKLENGNNKNWLKINREPSLDSGGRFGYLAFYAFKIRYEDWINFPGMPNDFFSATELNNGFHNDWIHYLNTIGWQMNFYTEIDAVENNELKRYKNKFKFKFKDYDLNQLISTQHRYYRDSDNTLLNVGTDPISGRPLGVIISNEPTRLEIEYEIMDGGTWDIANVYATATIEIDKGAGIMQMRQLSSVWGSENDNPLIPLPGQTKLKIEVDATLKRLTTKCLIDPDLLDDAIRYRITGRVGCFANGGSFEFGKYEARYEDKYE